MGIVFADLALWSASCFPAQRARNINSNNHYNESFIIAITIIIVFLYFGKKEALSTRVWLKRQTHRVQICVTWNERVIRVALLVAHSSIDGVLAVLEGWT